MNKETKHRQGVYSIIFLAVLYGILPLIPRYLSTSFEVFQQVYLRMGTGFLLSLLFFHKQIDIKKIKKLPAKEWGVVAFRAFIYYFLGVSLFTQALILTKISNVAFIGAIPMTGVLGFLLLKEKFNLKKASLILISFLGVIFISVQDFSNLFSFGKGEILALLSTLFVSLGFISRRWQSDILNDKEVATLMLMFATIFLFLGSVIKGEGLPLENWHLGVFLALLIGGLLNVGVSFLMNYGFARVNAVLASNLIALEPIFAAIFAFIVFRELPIPKELIGGFIILASAIAMNRVESNKKTFK
ncbi:MAG: DMT family transporter [Candidatus Pacebacteria bacterium]|jgi:drug/metabolite transporter (DMT)-like permease|nr:DMT family transporter [Candidatus Paceibacterota bacterium]MBT6921393.1 DMT family transporter [Candidatus Paceibacterota bacterium]